ncbi:arsenate reductase (glutaredoxin) [Aliigemmobacter aestuarii]|uniref:Arsenate reductase n=1 Tax=Aliigemmobacter aestuarii TaxID=1445661 RepID=A0A4S3MLA4_9RHOB|nr:arsenate reductase (glutaredoxin) [Gemmobacter aestuarii]THD81514.1 arsenate reductase (glutaredoxin) [Gemmobacter aestuarii]
MTESVIFHHPGCSTSRRVLDALREAGHDPQVVAYTKAGWTEAQLRDLFAAAGLTAAEALRRKAKEAAELDLLRPDVTEADLLAAMVAHPVLVERPFVTTAKGTRLCRPVERLAEIL